jgi:beta-phosphoglucomutase-like phosphatase (HAD superfamily)
VTTSTVIFDLDGVLVDSEPLWREGFRAAVELVATSVGDDVPQLSDDELRQYEGGRVPDTVATLAAALFGDDIAPETLDAAVEVAITTASELFAEHPTPIAASVVVTVTKRSAPWQYCHLPVPASKNWSESKNRTQQKRKRVKNQQQNL